ncbi:MAG: HAD family phosphatase [Spirochaetales bacterium]|nr:HAD family phosphatase [Spirochaetales bacterium]
MIDTVLFDFDGTLVDSEPNYAISDCRMVAHFGGKLSLEEHSRYVGFGSHPFLKAMKERYSIEASLEEMRQVQSDFYLKLARENTLLFPVMEKLLEKLKDRGVSMAVASGTPQNLLEELVHRTGVGDYVDLILSTETAGREKPHPAVFLEAAERLGKKKKNCLVLEDSINGAHAGVRAGMETVVLVSPYHKERIDEYPREARLVEGGIEAFDPKLILNRVCEQDS